MLPADPPPWRIAAGAPLAGLALAVLGLAPLVPPATAAMLMMTLCDGDGTVRLVPLAAQDADGNGGGQDDGCPQACHALCTRRKPGSESA